MITFDPRHINEDRSNWISAGSKITSESSLALIREELEDEGPILVCHWFYKAGCGPDFLLFNEEQEFIQYLVDSAHAGDAIGVWSCLRITNNLEPIADGKCPDKNERIPEFGSY